MRVIFCGSCGAPLDAAWNEITVVCRFCGAHNQPGAPGDAVPPVQPDDGRPRIHIDGRSYVLEGRLARGASCHVYRARWVMRLGELVVVKVLHSLRDEDLLRAEWSTLQRLFDVKSQGASHFQSRLPAPIAMGTVHADCDRLCTVYSWQSGFIHTLGEVHAVHPRGVKGEIVVWLLKRMLEQLGWCHSLGVVHGAVLPPHVLVHPFNHGANLISWSAATTTGELAAISRDWRAWYPDSVLKDHEATPRTDVIMAARCAITAAGSPRGSIALPEGFPAPLGELLMAASDGEHDDAWAFKDRLVEVAAEVFGPPAYNPLLMPGWNRHQG